MTEDAPILDLVLDHSGRCESLWVATTATHVNKWPIDPNKPNGFHSDEEDLSEEEGRVTAIDDDPPPFFTKPIATLPGQRSIHIPRIYFTSYGHIHQTTPNF